MDRGDRAVLRRGDALLQLPHFRRQGRLVADGARHAPEQGADFAARLGEAEDVVDEKQHVLVLDVAEIFGHREPGKADAHTRSGRFVHLPEDEGGLREDPRFLHFVVEVVAFAAALADARENRGAVVLGRQVEDQLLDQDGFADARAAEEADLAAFDVRAKEVDDLDAGLEDLALGRLLLEGRGRAVDRHALLRLEGLAVDRVAEDVEHAPEGLLPDGDGNRRLEGDGFHAADDAVGRAHGDAADDVVADVLHDFDRQRLAVLEIDAEGGEDLREPFAWGSGRR